MKKQEDSSQQEPQDNTPPQKPQGGKTPTGAQSETSPVITFVSGGTDVALGFEALKAYVAKFKTDPERLKEYEKGIEFHRLAEVKIRSRRLRVAILIHEILETPFADGTGHALIRDRDLYIKDLFQRGELGDSKSSHSRTLRVGPIAVGCLRQGVPVVDSAEPYVTMAPLPTEAAIELCKELQAKHGADWHQGTRVSDAVKKKTGQKVKPKVQDKVATKQVQKAFTTVRDLLAVGAVQEARDLLDELLTNMAQGLSLVKSLREKPAPQVAATPPVIPVPADGADAPPPPVVPSIPSNPPVDPAPLDYSETTGNVRVDRLKNRVWVALIAENPTQAAALEKFCLTFGGIRDDLYRFAQPVLGMPWRLEGNSKTPAFELAGEAMRWGSRYPRAQTGVTGNRA